MFSCFCTNQQTEPVSVSGTEDQEKKEYRVEDEKEAGTSKWSFFKRKSKISATDSRNVWEGVAATKAEEFHKSVTEKCKDFNSSKTQALMLNDPLISEMVTVYIQLYMAEKTKVDINAKINIDSKKGKEEEALIEVVETTVDIDEVKMLSAYVKMLETSLNVKTNVLALIKETVACPISTLLSDDPIVAPCCGNTFDRNQLAIWKMTKSVCPLCRASLDPFDVAGATSSVCIKSMCDILDAPKQFDPVSKIIEK